MSVSGTRWAQTKAVKELSESYGKIQDSMSELKEVIQDNTKEVQKVNMEMEQFEKDKIEYNKRVEYAKHHGFESYAGEPKAKFMELDEVQALKKKLNVL